MGEVLGGGGAWSRGSGWVRQGWRNEKKVGGLTLPLNGCTEAGVQGLHSEESFPPLASEKVVGLTHPPLLRVGGGG